VAELLGILLIPRLTQIPVMFCLWKIPDNNPKVCGNNFHIKIDLWRSTAYT